MRTARQRGVSARKAVTPLSWHCAGIITRNLTEASGHSSASTGSPCSLRRRSSTAPRRTVKSWTIPMATELMPLEERYEVALNSLGEKLTECAQARGDAERLEARLKQ